MTSDAEIELLRILAMIGVRTPRTEYRFHETRRWRFDLAWPAERVAVEIEGGRWVGGRHTRGAGFEADMEKYNEAALLGWTVIRVTPGMVRDGRALAYVERALKITLDNAART
jgi:very-short-patch-repair endonuclease